MMQAIEDIVSIYKPRVYRNIMDYLDFGSREEADIPYYQEIIDFHKKYIPIIRTGEESISDLLYCY